MARTSLFLLLFLPLLTVAQKIRPEKIGRLTKMIHKSSGLARMDSTTLWTMNDHGTNDLFKVSKQRPRGGFCGRREVYKGSVPIEEVLQHDWEDLTQDDGGNIYIGDFGNNTNRRSSLAIYRVKIPQGVISPVLVDSVKSAPALTGQKISFHYPDQNQFPPPPSNWNFDCEAFLHEGDSLYLFSKNVSNPNDGFTRMYRVPDQPGEYVAELVDSFCLNEPVTGAGISPDGKTVVLLTYFSLWVFRDFPEHDFFRGKVYQFPFNKLTQKEAICFANDHELYITDERHYGRGGKLYKIDLLQLDFSKPTIKFKRQFYKKAIYNIYNNPKVKYKKVMKQIRSSGI